MPPTDPVPEFTWAPLETVRPPSPHVPTTRAESTDQELPPPSTVTVPVPSGITPISAELSDSPLVVTVAPSATVRVPVPDTPVSNQLLSQYEPEPVTVT